MNLHIVQYYLVPEELPELAEFSLATGGLCPGKAERNSTKIL
jgi:hypothetical protein